MSDNRGLLKERYPFLAGYLEGGSPVYKVSRVEVKEIDLYFFSRSFKGLWPRTTCLGSSGEFVGVVGHSYYMPNPKWRWWMRFKIVRRGLVPRDIRFPGSPLPGLTHYIFPRYDRKGESLATYVRRLPYKDMCQIKFVIFLNVERNEEREWPYPASIILYEVPDAYTNILELLNGLEESSGQYLL